jgi:hypothetical protein
MAPRDAIDWASVLAGAYGAATALAEYQRHHPPADPIDTNPVDGQGKPLTAAPRINAIRAQMAERLAGTQRGEPPNSPAVVAALCGADLGSAVEDILRQR